MSVATRLGSLNPFTGKHSMAGRLSAALLHALILPTLPAAAASPVLSPEQEQQTFQLDDGLRIELVASEPMVQDPVAMTFDGQGRLWVVEMRGFMPDIDGEGETNANGRVSILEDLDHDGIMDRSTVFMDGLVLPRAIAVTSSGVLIAENKWLWWAEDADRDGRADRRVLVDADYGATNAVEHSSNGLWRGLDNWYYNAKSDRRYQGSGRHWHSEPTEKRGQWGICHDDDGRLFYNYNHSQLHVDLVPPSLLGRNPNHQPTSGISEPVSTNQQVFPIHPTPAANRGYIPGTLDDQLRIRAFTSACAPLIHRGDALPAPYRGNAFVCEPVGNLIKRNVLTRDGLAVRAKPAPNPAEFLASTDERFRPVFLADGPDGALYVADMYRGIVQHKFYLTPYLRRQSLDRGLVQPIHKGRIWRIVPKDWHRPQPRSLAAMSDTETLQLLGDSNGWWRDRAQQHLVEHLRSDLIPDLRRIAWSHKNPRARLHALWTLHGLRDQQTTWLKAAKDPHPAVQAAAIRMLETPVLNKVADEVLESALETPARGDDLRLVVAATLTADRLSYSYRIPLLASVISRHVDQPVVRDSVLSSLSGVESALLQRLWDDPSWTEESLGKSIFFESLANTIVYRRRTDEILELLERLDGPALPLDWKQRALLSGMAVHGVGRSFQPIALPSQPRFFKRQGRIADQTVLARLQRLDPLFSWPGHSPRPAVSSSRQTLSARDQKLFVQGRTLYLTLCAACHGNDGEGLKPLGPPLAHSDWVRGPDGVLIRILLQGMSGPVTVNDTRFEAPNILPEMPSLTSMDNEDMAAVLTYIRRAWDHAADPVTPKRVNRIRIETQGRDLPWTEKELLEFRDTLEVETEE